MNRALSLIALVPALLSCVHVEAEMLVPPSRYAAVPADSVRVFLSEQELRDRGYEWEAVAILFASGSADYTTNQGMLRRLREEAGKRGANGIFLQQSREPNLGERFLWGSSAQRRSQVAAIRWRPRVTPGAPADSASGRPREQPD